MWCQRPMSILNWYCSKCSTFFSYVGLSLGSSLQLVCLSRTSKTSRFPKTFRKLESLKVMHLVTSNKMHFRKEKIISTVKHSGGSCIICCCLKAPRPEKKWNQSFWNIYLKPKPKSQAVLWSETDLKLN